MAVEQLVDYLSLSYAFKRVIRSWRLFVALLFGVVLASTFFAGINIGADTAAKQALDQQLSYVPVDIVVWSGWGPVFQQTATSISIWSSANATEVADIISGSGIEGIASTEVISRGDWMVQVDNGIITPFFEVVGISDDSRVYDGLTVTDGSSSLGANETYVWADSPSASDLKIGDVLSANFSVWLGDEMKIPPQETWITLNLTVAGFVELDNKASLIALGHYYYYTDTLVPMVVTSQENVYKENLLIADWNETFAKLLDVVYDMSPQYTPIETQILVFLDRASLIGPWDIPTSIDKVRAITSQINNKVLGWGAHAENYLEDVLNNYQFVSQDMRFQFLVTALPVFFMAWYMGTTVSDVSLNLRRREIGLLLTKGFSRGQLLRMFLSEASLIGLIGGLIGIGLSLLLSPFFVTAAGGRWFSGAPVIGTDTAILVVIFSVAITFLSMFRPARRASQLQAVDALREYRYVEETKPYKKRWPWVALFFGTYKITMWLFGINLATLMMRPPPTTNILLMILLGIWIFLDVYVLNYIGPILFFWGLAKILIHGSLKFQELTTKATRFLGDLGSLATKNVQRNPARVASTAFLIALIIAYSFQVTGIYASERDYTIRQIQYNIGADVSVQLTTLINASYAMSEIESLPGVYSTVLEYSFSGSSAFQRMIIRAADPERWLETAYYESELFTGNDVKTAFHQMATDNNTIILERKTATQLKLGLGDTIALTFGSEVHALNIVGFFGSELPQDQSYRIDWISYVPEGFYTVVEEEVSATARILVKLASGADGKAVVDQIRGLEAENISTVNSVLEELEEWQSNVLLSGSLNVQLLGVAFAVLVASIGTALVTSVSLRERSREMSIMSARGLSFKQLVTILLAENLAVVVFAVMLGAAVGLIIVRGNVVAANTNPLSYSILARHMVFPMDTLLTLFACFVLVFASAIIPVIVMSRRYVSRLERIVR
ncbi:MAG: ABC transporter permease [Candidatus Bathyarchaeota archaeon]|nr:ABC transporter permease [Candidatus Bathyarchaeota archaeon]